MSYLRRNNPYSAKAFNEDAGRIPQPQSLSKKLGTPDASAPTPARRPIDLSRPLEQSNPLDQNSKIPELIATSANSRVLSTILEAQKKKLETQETLINAMPEKDENGRVKSGLRAALQGLAEMFDPRYGSVKDWGEFGARAAGAAGRGLGGAINPAWDEKADKEKARVKFRQEYEQYSKDADAEVNRASKIAMIEDRQADNLFQQEKLGKTESRLNRQLDDRIARNKFQTLNDEKKLILSNIMKRGYYYEGEPGHETEDAELKRLGIVLPDFDTTRKPMVENGKRKAWNPETKTYEQIEGTEVDPDEEPITFVVDGEKMTASRKYFLNYKASKERQTTQLQQSDQHFNTNLQQRRTEFIENYKLKLQQMRQSNQFKQADELLKLEGEKAKGTMDEDTYNQMKRIIIGQ